MVKKKFSDVRLIGVYGPCDGTGVFIIFIRSRSRPDAEHETTAIDRAESTPHCTPAGSKGAL